MPCIAFIKGSNVMKKSYSDRIVKMRDIATPQTKGGDAYFK